MLRRAAAYLLMLGGSIGAFYWVMSAGRHLPSASGGAWYFSPMDVDRLTRGLWPALNT